MYVCVSISLTVCLFVCLSVCLKWVHHIEHILGVEEESLCVCLCVVPCK